MIIKKLLKIPEYVIIVLNIFIYLKLHFCGSDLDSVEKKKQIGNKFEII